VDAIVDSLGIGVWFGLTGPIALHVAYVVIVGNPGTNLSRVVRFLGIPLFLIGIMGIAGSLGPSGSWSALGMFFGFAVYGLCAWLHRRRHKSRLATDGT
jgi:hypothetical protein